MQKPSPSPDISLLLGRNRNFRGGYHGWRALTQEEAFASLGVRLKRRAITVGREPGEWFRGARSSRVDATTHLQGRSR
jgi:hypothetical protein